MLQRIPRTRNNVRRTDIGGKEHYDIPWIQASEEGDEEPYSVQADSGQESELCHQRDPQTLPALTDPNEDPNR